MEIRKRSEFSTVDDMQGFYVYQKGDVIGETPEGFNLSMLIDMVNSLDDEHVLVIPAK
jgi:hypothetical protein